MQCAALSKQGGVLCRDIFRYRSMTLPDLMTSLSETKNV